MPDMMVYNPGTWEEETGGLAVQGQPLLPQPVPREVQGWSEL